MIKGIKAVGLFAFTGMTTINTTLDNSVADILPFKRKKASEKHKGKTLCANNHHKWKIETARKFDVKQGRLLTLYRCERCGKEKSKLL